MGAYSRVHEITVPMPNTFKTCKEGYSLSTLNTLHACSLHVLYTSASRTSTSTILYRLSDQLVLNDIWLASLSMISGVVGWKPRSNKGDKQGLGISKRSKKRFEAQQMEMLLGSLAHNVVAWSGLGWPPLLRHCSSMACYATSSMWLNVTCFGVVNCLWRLIRDVEKRAAFLVTFCNLV